MLFFSYQTILGFHSYFFLLFDYFDSVVVFVVEYLYNPFFVDKVLDPVNIEVQDGDHTVVLHVFIYEIAIDFNTVT